VLKTLHHKGVDAPITGDNVRRPRQDGVTPEYTQSGITTGLERGGNKGVDAPESGDNVRRPPQPGARLKGNETGYGGLLQTRG